MGAGLAYVLCSGCLVGTPPLHKLLKAISFDLSMGFCALYIIGSSWEVDYDREVLFPSDFIFMWCKGLECRSNPTSLFSSLLTSFALVVLIISFDLLSGFSIATCQKQAPDKEIDMVNDLCPNEIINEGWIMIY